MLSVQLPDNGKVKKKKTTTNFILLCTEKWGIKLSKQNNGTFTLTLYWYK